MKIQINRYIYTESEYMLITLFNILIDDNYTNEEPDILYNL